MVIMRKIYVKLLDEGVETWRPTFGEEISDGVFKVLPIDNYDPELETWEFIPGTVVRCELQSKADRRESENVLVAVEKIINKLGR